MQGATWGKDLKGVGGGQAGGGPPSGAKGPAPTWLYVLFAILIWLCSSWAERRVDGRTRALRLWVLSRQHPSWGRADAEKQRNVADRGMGQRGQGGGQRDRHGSPQLPGSSNAPSPQGSSPQARSSPLGTAWGGCHWPGSWCRGRKGSSGKGAFSRSTPCSRSMQHCRGVGR